MSVTLNDSSAIIEAKQDKDKDKDKDKHKHKKRSKTKKEKEKTTKDSAVNRLSNEALEHQVVNKKIDGISKGSHDEDKKRKSESKRKHKPKTKDKDKDVPLEVLCVWGEDKRLIKATKATPLDLLVQIIKDEYGTFPIQIKYKNETWGEFITITKDADLQVLFSQTLRVIHAFGVLPVQRLGRRNRSSKQTTSIGSGSGSKSSKSGRSVGISASRPSSKKTPPTTPTNSSSGLIGSTSSVGSRETLYRTHSEPSPMINISTNNDNQKDDPGHHGEEKHNITGGGGHIEPNDSNDNSFNSNNNNNSSGNTYPITNSSSHSSGSTNNTKDTNENDADYIDSEGDTPESGSGRKPKSSRTQALRQSDARADLEKNTWFIPYSQLDMRNSKMLGKGFFGEVKLAYWLRQPVACKILFKKEFRRTNEMERFVREVDVLSKLRHPKVILFLGASIGPNMSEMIIVTEYMSNGSLYQFMRLQEEGLLNDQFMMLRVATDISLGMNYLHEASCVHRDLNSKNILLDENLSAKVADFGLSKFSTDEPLSNSNTMGAVAWMAPEIIEDPGRFTPAADVYSFAMVIWEMLTGRSPNQVVDVAPVKFAQKVVQDDYRPPLPISGCPSFWKDLIEICWTRFTLQRPSFGEILDMLRTANLKTLVKEVREGKKKTCLSYSWSSSEYDTDTVDSEDGMFDSADEMDPADDSDSVDPHLVEETLTPRRRSNLDSGMSFTSSLPATRSLVDGTAIPNRSASTHTTTTTTAFTHSYSQSPSRLVQISKFTSSTDGSSTDGSSSDND